MRESGLIRPGLVVFLAYASQCLAHWHRPHLESSWTGWGGNYHNDRQAYSTKVNSHSLPSLHKHCQFDVTGGNSAPPAIQGSIAYFQTYNGLIVSYNFADCQVVWQTNVTEIIYSYSAPDSGQDIILQKVSRTSPQIGGDVLYLGTLLHALLVALDVKTGALLGMKQIHPHPFAIITQSPTYYNGQLFVGASSSEESAAILPGYECCSFAGTFAAFTFSRRTGQFTTKWNVTMLPEPIGVGGWSGAAIWGSQPAIDEARQQVFVATGNAYELPDSVQACVNNTQPESQSSCFSDDVLAQAVVAFDIRTGHINWASVQAPIEAWTVACGVPGFSPKLPTCPPNPGPDADFGMAPAFVSGKAADTPQGADIVVVGQKSGVLFAMDAINGSVYWAAYTSPDSGSTGGLTWGIAVDQKQVYFTAVNSGAISWETLPSGRNITNSAYGAVALRNGTILWETPVPHGSQAQDPPTVVNDLVLVGRNADYNGDAQPSPAQAYGSVVILSTAGSVLDEIPVNTVMYGGIAVLDKYVMFGSGYRASNITGSFYVYKVGSHGWW